MGNHVSVCFYRPHHGAYKLPNLIFLNCELGGRLKKTHEEIFFPLQVSCARTSTLCGMSGRRRGCCRCCGAVFPWVHNSFWGQILCSFGSVSPRPAVISVHLESYLSKRRVGKSRSLRLHSFLRNSFFGSSFKTQSKDQITL